MKNEFESLPPEMQEIYKANAKELPEDWRKPFHSFNKDGKPTKAIDMFIREDIKKNTHIMVIGQFPWIYENGCYKQDEGGKKLKALITEYIYPRLVTARVIGQIYDLFICDRELDTSVNEVNQFPPEWINFQNGFYDPRTNSIIPHDPKYKAVNILPWSYVPGEDYGKGEAIEKWIRSLQLSDDDIEMLMQYCGLCMNFDTRFQKCLFVVGAGGTGKSTLLDLIGKVVGADNFSAITLENVEQRFYPALLFGKLLNVCADIKTTILCDQDAFKKITGQDWILLERKGKDAIKFKSYAKLLFSMNSIPNIKGENSSGFYRRMLVLRMDKEVKAPDPALAEKLEADIPYFIDQVMQFMRLMYEAGKITESASSRREVEELRCYSDSVQAFLTEKCTCNRANDQYKTDRAKLYSEYKNYCSAAGRQTMSNQSFYKSLKDKGYSTAVVNGFPMVKGIVFGKLENQQAAFVSPALHGSQIDIVTPKDTG